jgi:hypothetical protein
MELEKNKIETKNKIQNKKREIRKEIKEIE